MLIIVRSYSNRDLIRLLDRREFSLSPHTGFRQDIRFSYTMIVTTTQKLIPDIMLRPNKDARARSDRLQLGTAHIQSFTQTRQVSVVMGMTRFWAAIGS